MCFNGAVVLLHVERTSGPWLLHWPKLGQISCEDSVVVSMFFSLTWDPNVALHVVWLVVDSIKTAPFSVYESLSQLVWKAVVFWTIPLVAQPQEIAFCDSLTAELRGNW